MAGQETAIVLPDGTEHAVGAASDRLPPGHGTVVNETGLPDDLVLHGVSTFIEEHASMLGVSAGNTFQTYANSGSLLARGSTFRVPKNQIEEIVLARDLAERDDDVAATIGAMIATAFGDGMQQVHKDEVTKALFEEIGRHANLDGAFGELYRELLIASSVTTVCAFTQEDFQFTPEGADRQRTRRLIAPLVGVLPAEQVRVIGNDMFGTGVLAYRPATGAQERWLREFFEPTTTPARKAEMRREDPLLTALVVERLDIQDEEPAVMYPEGHDQPLGQDLYRLNPRMVHRSTFPKGAWKYPRPILTRNFPLLEAKRLLNLMDYALLQGGSNFLVVAKKGTDQRPALPIEVENLRETVRRASRSGVIVGDHRLNIEIITPDLGELLSAQKRNLIGRKLANALLRVPEGEMDPGGEQVKARTEILQRVVEADRRLLRRHVEAGPYREVARRNQAGLPQGPARLWFPRIILTGGQWFTDYVLKMRDRGDISRHSAVAAGGFDYENEVAARKREKPDDRVMTPAEVPFSSPGQPQDNGPGRPPGASSNNGAGRAQEGPARARPRRVISRNAGETVTARFEEEVGSYRIGELTFSILEEYQDTQAVGRITSSERAALGRIAEGEWAPFHEGGFLVVPVNEEYGIENVRAVRLTQGASLLVGDRDDAALVARALVFRSTEFDDLAAQELAMRWGFYVEAPERERVELERPALPAGEEEHAAARESAPVLHLTIDTGHGKVKRTVIRDKDGNITGTEEEPVGDPEAG